MVASVNDVSVAFGPVVQDGVGVCYNILPDKMLISTSAFRNASQPASTIGPSPDSLALELGRAFDDMIELVVDNEHLGANKVKSV
ncbi:unnamed protein product [Protopolystoma xenopodis]|uniref:Choline/carnitine acyltransferase domain-containing protein n=1 Tax=Protopolystoma xenopodis TaxID=117903 RepID=A0A448WKG4_9PLAT|nr:unnamed protein product [Protopolystoma xenopodis]